MNILIVHNNYIKFSGEENAIGMMIATLEKHGHKVFKFMRSSEGIENSLIKKVHAFFSGIYSFSSKKSIEEFLDNNVIDLIQVQNLYPYISTSVLRACKARNIPIVMRCPNYRLFCPTGLHLYDGQVCVDCLGAGREWNCVSKNCEKNIFKSIGYASRNAFARKTGMIFDNVDVFLVLSEFQKQRFIEGGIPEEKLSILPNIAPYFDGDLSSTGEYVSFTGRVSPEKGIQNFLDAAKQLPDVKFSVAGGLDLMPEVKAIASENVKFEGFLQGKEYEEFYRQSKMLVFPSMWFEGFPNVIAQAMAYGKPIIASRIGAIPEIVEDGITGLLFEPGNSEDITDKIRQLIDNPDLCVEMGRAGQKKAREEYSDKRYYDYLSSAYAKAIKINSSTFSR